MSLRIPQYDQFSIHTYIHDAVNGCNGAACFVWVSISLKSAGVTPQRMSSMYIEAGDLGDVAEQCKSKQRMLVPHPPLTARGVFAKLHEISKSKGTKSAQRKQAIISALLRASRHAILSGLIVWWFLCSEEPIQSIFQLLLCIDKINMTLPAV